MDSDEHRHNPAVSARQTGSDALGARVVLVADSDPAVTDEIATLLRDRYTVRTAYDSADALASLDADVGVVLLDPDLPGLSARRVVDRASGPVVDCQVAALTEGDPDLAATAFDECIRKPVAADDLRETVACLSNRAAYRSTLEEYYSVAERLAETGEDDPERDRLDRRLSSLGDRLEETFDELEGDEAYDAALRELNTR